jgi:hypothetical protein
MAGENCAVTHALALMKQALELMDRGGSGASSAACYLAMAIDAAEGQPILKTESEARAWFAAQASLLQN